MSLETGLGIKSVNLKSGEQVYNERPAVGKGRVVCLGELVRGS